MGRLRRREFWWRLLVSALMFALLFTTVQRFAGRPATLILYVPAFAIWFSLASRRLHDQARSAWWLVAAFVPILGPALLAYLLLFRRGTRGENQYGPDPRDDGRDYLEVRFGEHA